MMTIKDMRQKDIERLAAMLDGNTAEARYIMNCFYRIAGLYERLTVIENDAELYERYTRNGWLDQDENKLEKMTRNINEHLKPAGYRINLESACASIVKPDNDSRGCIAEIFTLGHWYR